MTKERPRIPVERLQVGDRVQAVSWGREGIVLRNEERWTVVGYERDKMCYKHGADQLYLLEAAPLEAIPRTYSYRVVLKDRDGKLVPLGSMSGTRDEAEERLRDNLAPDVDAWIERRPDVWERVPEGE